MAKSRKSSTNTNVATKAIRRAIRKSDPTHEPPTVGKPVIIDAPHHSTEWLNWLQQNGFTEQRPFMRMFIGDNKWPGKPDQQFAILGPEFG